MDETDIRQYFSKELKDDVEGSVAVAALKTLLRFIELDQSGTISELVHMLKTVAIKTLTTAESAVASVNSVSELFLRFITLTGLDHSDFKECKNALLQRGRVFQERVATAKMKVAKFGHPFILDGTVVLTHSRSRVVYHTLCEAARRKKRFQVFVTESQPGQSGKDMYQWLTKRDIPSTLILDAAVGYIMEKVDLVLIGAEGVVESGGIINKIGTFNVAVCAKAMNKPVYVLAERFKFVRMYPLNQSDVPNQFKYPSAKVHSEESLKEEHPLVDYTPPAYITLLFTEIGILTPAAVSDELIKLYL